MITRDEIILEYLDRLLYAPYPLQEEAIYAWAACEDGVLLSAPTGTGKTLVAEAAVYEGLRTGKVVYYTTPLIALTDQKFLEMQDTVERWGFSRDDVGLVTGNRTVNPDAPIKVVVAEMLLNRLLHPEAFDFSQRRRGGDGRVPQLQRPAARHRVGTVAVAAAASTSACMLLSATVGAAQEFVNWMAPQPRPHGSTLVEGTERQVPLTSTGSATNCCRTSSSGWPRAPTPTARRRRWCSASTATSAGTTAELLQGQGPVHRGPAAGAARPARRVRLLRRLGQQAAAHSSRAASASITPGCCRGIAAWSKTLFQEKLLPVCVCTETLAAGINLPARSVVLTTLVKGPLGKKKLIDAEHAQQMFGRAGRPQFDTEGHVYALAHEDDVQDRRGGRQKYDPIPEDDERPRADEGEEGAAEEEADPPDRTSPIGTPSSSPSCRPPRRRSCRARGS